MTETERFVCQIVSGIAVIGFFILYLAAKRLWKRIKSGQMRQLEKLISFHEEQRRRFYEDELPK